MRQVSKLARTLILIAAVAGGAVLLSVSQPALAACEGERIDKTTADDARKKIQAAGYTQARDLKKGCDNFWHGWAMKAGVSVRVVVTPQGQVMEEGN